MIRIASTVACIALSAGLAHGQSFQTALPLDPGERRAMEVRLSTILEFAAPGEVARIALPSGRVLAVRPYHPVQRPGESPCRGYRIDLVDPGQLVAVDGFRCRRSDGAAWVIVEPEIVLAQEGGPLDLTGTVSPLETEEPFDFGVPDTEIPEEEAREPARGYFSAGEVPPVPRPAPRQELAAAGPVTDPVASDTPDAGEAPVDEVAEEVIAAPLSPLPPTANPAPAATVELPDDTTAASIVSRDVTPAAPASAVTPAAPEAPAATTGPAAASTPERVAAAAPAPGAGESTRARVVGGRAAAEGLAWSGDPRILSALRDLAYLGDGSPTPSAARVQSAIDAFARDERFALPVSSSALIARLDAAIARRDGLRDCATAPAGAPCLVSD